MQVLVRDGVALHYEVEHGPAGAPAVVFSNSLGTDLRIWSAVLARLAGAFSLVTYDKRGHGLSDAPPSPYTLSDHVGDLAAILDALGTGPAVICGLSVGGLIAQGLAQARPDLVRALILCDTADRIGSNDIWNERILQARTLGLVAMADGIMARWFTQKFLNSDPSLSAWRNMLARTSVEGYAGTCATVRDSDLTAYTTRIAVPVLCLVGAEDLTTPPELVSGLAARIPGARFEIIAGAGHIPCVEQPEILARRIHSFVTGLDAEAAS